MHFKTRDIEINPAHPFQNDLFGLEKFAKVLSKIVNATEDGCTLSIEAGWGLGKTTFVKMWQKSLINEEVTTVYVNAWETDFAQDPMMALIDSLAQNIKSLNPECQHYKALSPIVNSLIKFVKSTPGISWVGNIAEVVKQTIDSLKEDNNSLDEYQTYSSIVSEFKESLSILVEKLPQKKLVIFVDELDRCRPNYAIEMLERIKHLFSIPNIVFVLSIDRSVILESIKGFYNSSNINAENYLRRFIDLSFKLPKPTIPDFVIAQYAYHGLEETEDSYKNYMDKTYMGMDHHRERLQAITNCFTITTHSLRDIEKFFNLLDITLHSISTSSDIELITWLVYAQIFKQEVYEKIKCSGKTEEEMLLYLETNLFEGYISNSEDMDAYLSYCICLLALSYCDAFHMPTMNKDNLDTFRYEHIGTYNFFNIHQAANNTLFHCHNLEAITQQIELIDSHFSICDKE